MPESKRGGGLVAALLLVYPLLVYFGLQYLQPRLFGAALALLLVLRWLLARRHLSAALRRQLYPVLAMGGACALAALLFDSAASLRLLPAAISAICLISFALTLWRPPTMIERFARAMDPNFGEHGIAYTRRVTQVWCVFFLGNGAVALYTALYASLAVWTLYNGLVAYVLMGLLFAGEYLVRRRVIRAALP